ncbi:hypothetical protein PAESOLCIP111_00944 [Paenibacillus solanacearum]|uniref:DUF2092 domain-containing protein n=1 Tax=Paenibacillus solanacearum TaxID=2048548 RepID=A0A916NGG2_9BACL|nr:hypothetical protein [Paenibacillus solanacearum]CAG7607309.1 hypothetical protein PAESOLCIP111_00944 [Paenibacillus solanacearum]
MKNKWLTAGACIGIGVMLLAGGAYSARADAPGYEMYKTALQQLHSAASFTVTADVSVTDNGAKVADAQAAVKHNRELETVSVAATVDHLGETHSMNMYRQDGQMIVKSSESDVYKVVERGPTQWKQDGPPQIVGHVIDNVASRMWEHAKVEAADDGGTQITLDLTGSELPVPVKAVSSFILSKAANNPKWEQMPRLSNNTALEQIHIAAKLGPDARMERQTAQFVVTGNDEAGVHHVIAVQLDAHITDVDRTVSDRIDLTDKPLETVQPRNGNHEAIGRGWHRQ